MNIHLDVASNFSLFFFLRHFHGLKKRPSALNLLLRSSGGVRTPLPRLLVRSAAPFCFLAAMERKTTHIKTGRTEAVSLWPDRNGSWSG